MSSGAATAGGAVSSANSAVATPRAADGNTASPDDAGLGESGLEMTSHVTDEQVDDFLNGSDAGALNSAAAEEELRLSSLAQRLDRGLKLAEGGWDVGRWEEREAERGGGRRIGGVDGRERKKAGIGS